MNIFKLQDSTRDTEKTIDVESSIRKAFDENVQVGIEMIFRSYYVALCSHAARFVPSKAMAEDIVSDILFEFQTKGIYATVTTSYQAYLFKSVRNRVYDYLRKVATHSDISMEAALFLNSNSSEQPDSIIQLEELHRMIEKTIDAMPVKRREVYMLNKHEHMKSKDIAEVLHLSRRTIEAHLYAASEQLKTVLKQDGFI